MVINFNPYFVICFVFLLLFLFIWQGIFRLVGAEQMCDMILCIELMNVRASATFSFTFALIYNKFNMNELWDDLEDFFLLLCGNNLRKKSDPIPMIY